MSKIGNAYSVMQCLALTLSVRIRIYSSYERDFFEAYPNLEAVFQDTIHGQGQLLKLSIHHFLSLTTRFSLL